MTSDRNQDARARGPRIAAAWLGIAAFALAAAGCAMGGAGSASYTAPTAPAASAASAPATGQAIATQATPLGVILVDGQRPHRVRVRQRHQRHVGMHRGVRHKLAAGRGAVPAAHVAARGDRSARRDHPRRRDQPAHQWPATRCTRSPATPHPARPTVRARPSMAACGPSRPRRARRWRTPTRPPPRRQPRSLQLLRLVRQAGSGPACRLGRHHGR